MGFRIYFLRYNVANLISNPMIVLDLIRFFTDEIFFYLRFLALTYYLQSVICLIRRIKYRPNTSWPVILSLII